MKDVGELPVMAQEEVRRDLRAMFRGAIRASLEVFLAEELEALVGAPRVAREVARVFTVRISLHPDTQFG